MEAEIFLKIWKTSGKSVEFRGNIRNSVHVGGNKVEVSRKSGGNFCLAGMADRENIRKLVEKVIDHDLLCRHLDFC